jgi:hypothetical protein
VKRETCCALRNPRGELLAARAGLSFRPFNKGTPVTNAILNLFKRPPRRGGGKDDPMPQGTPPTGSPAGAAPPATSDPTAALTDAVRQLAQSQATLLDALRQAPAQPAGPTGAAPAARSGDDIRRIVSDVLRERESSQQRTAARDRYVRERMADLPDAYRRLMPDAEDPADLAAAEADVRRRFRDDFRAASPATGPAGAADVSGDAPGGRRPAAAVDYSRLSPLQQITVGLRDLRPAQDAGRGTASAPTARGSEAPGHGEDAGAASGAAAEEFFGAD